MRSVLKDSFSFQQEIAPTDRKRTENVFTLSVLFSSHMHIVKYFALQNVKSCSVEHCEISRSARREMK